SRTNSTRNLALPSLRANGSRECAPDDRLRGSNPEPPSLPSPACGGGLGWGEIAWSLTLLAMTKGIIDLDLPSGGLRQIDDLAGILSVEPEVDRTARIALALDPL